MNRVLGKLLLVVLLLGLTVLQLAAQQNIVDDSGQIDLNDVCHPGGVGQDDGCALEGVSVIYSDTNSTNLHTLSETAVSLDSFDDGFYAYVCTAITQDNTQTLASGCIGDNGQGVAGLVGNIPISLAAGPFSYAVDTTHYYDFHPDGGCESGGTCLAIVNTSVDVTLGHPEITSVSPPYVFVGASGTLTIAGESLSNPFGGSAPTVSAVPGSPGGTGLSISGTLGNTGGTASYNATVTATTGGWDIGLSTEIGITFIANNFSGLLTVGDPTPSISSVSPNAWNAGQTNLSVTITGSGFGSNPQLSIIGAGIITYSMTGHSDNGQAGGAQITAKVTLAACAPSGPATITITSTGYNGTGFTPAFSGQPASSTSAATIVAAPAGAPGILFYGANEVGQKPIVVVGQEIVLTGQIPAQTCTEVASQHWSLPPGNAVGGFVGQTTPPLGAVQAVPTDTTSASYGPFYWITAGTFNMTYRYTLTSGVSSPVSTAPFKVTGLSSVKLYTCGGSGIGAGGCTTNGPLGKVAITAGPKLAFGGTADNIGIEFTASATAPSGDFVYVQEITGDTKTQTPANGGAVQTCYPPEVPTAGVFPGLDTRYPAATGVAMNDNPDTTLSNTYKNESRTFSAQMYLMWRPTKAAQCNGTNCTIPVPLGSVKWKFAGAAKLTNAANNTWAVTSGSGSADAFSASSSYPAWINWVSYQGNLVCH